MVTMTIYANVETFCWIVNILNQSLISEPTYVREVSLKRSRKFPCELQVPITTIGQFTKKNRTTVNLHTLQHLVQEQ